MDEKSFVDNSVFQEEKLSYQEVKQSEANGGDVRFISAPNAKPWLGKDKSTIKMWLCRKEKDVKSLYLGSGGIAHYSVSELVEHEADNSQDAENLWSKLYEMYPDDENGYNEVVIKVCPDKIDPLLPPAEFFRALYKNQGILICRKEGTLVFKLRKREYLPAGRESEIKETGEKQYIQKYVSLYDSWFEEFLSLSEVKEIKIGPYYTLEGEFDTSSYSNDVEDLKSKLAEVEEKLAEMKDREDSVPNFDADIDEKISELRKHFVECFNVLDKNFDLVAKRCTTLTDRIDLIEEKVNKTPTLKDLLKKMLQSLSE